MGKKQKTLHLMMTMVLVLSMLVPLGLQVAQGTPQARLSPQLVAAVAEAPDEMVRVIIQQTAGGQPIASQVARLGGQVLKDLSLINAIAAVLPGSSLTRLARTPGVALISLDAPVVSTGKGGGKGGDGGSGEEDPLPQNYFLDTLGVRQVWDMGYRGQGIAVAVVDSGVQRGKDFQVDPNTGSPESRVIVNIAMNPQNPTDTSDLTGHGTHVAGIIGGSGHKSDGAYAGIAPEVNLINIRISDDFGMAHESDSVAALEWIFNNKDVYNIRVVNLSIQSMVIQSYHDSPLNAAAEILWLNGVVVIASAGNKGSGEDNTIQAAPANDPFIITVGASDERGDSDRKNDKQTPYSAFGVTLAGFTKPEIYAPGQDIISVLAPASTWENEHPDRQVLDDYFRISGTSMAAPMVSGAVALLLQAEPDLTPDQVKFRLLYTSDFVDAGDMEAYMNVYAALTTPTTESANQGLIPHMLLAKMAMIAYWSSQNGEEEIDWASVDWDAVNWDAVDWEAVNWNAVNWNAVNWNAVNWNAVNWNAVNWNAVNWNAVNWNAVNWNAVNWNAVNWNAVNWNAVNWGD